MGGGKLGNTSLHPVSHCKPGSLWTINLPQVTADATVKAKLRSVTGINNMNRGRSLELHFVDVSGPAREMDGQNLQKHFLKIYPVSSTVTTPPGDIMGAHSQGWFPTPWALPGTPGNPIITVNVFAFSGVSWLRASQVADPKDMQGLGKRSMGMMFQRREQVKGGRKQGTFT